MLALLAAGFATLIAGFVALGIWQVERLHWKLDLIARVEARVHAPPVAAPGPAQWGSVTDQSAAYRHVAVEGQYRPGATLVLANTERGPGFWVLSPFATRGFTLLVNRGFVSQAQAENPTLLAPPAGIHRVTGLLRMSEPGGAFLRRNDPAGDRWYSRDVAAIAQAQRLGTVAPYFIDVDRAADPTAVPVGGLTVVHFRNAHLIYALTWFALGLLSVGGAFILFRSEWRLRRGR
ncbi:SURF1 family protein [Hephaestia sp. MAHUQ-44]|uniref:SURF1 family protein n=1 Tax=Hephaestia sp. MAHUQ-44 TaxID=2952526 RepID=UPI0020771CCF|nr:SURF1 family protein [Hephaestia sp. MAHUQ-44]